MRIINNKDTKNRLVDAFGAKVGCTLYGILSFVGKPTTKLKKWNTLNKLDKEYGSTLNNRKKWKKSFKKWIGMSNSEVTDYIMENFYKNPLEELKLIGEGVPDNPHVPMGIGVIQNEIARIPELLKYHRELGVERFVFVDNGSTDGTVEYLMKQDDVALYRTTDTYDYKIAWVNRLIDYCGIDRWYLKLDGDEFLVYPEIEEKNIVDYVRDLENKEIKRVRGFMLNMYPKEKLSEININPTEFRKYYQYYDENSDDYIFYTETSRLCGGNIRRTTGSNYAVISKTPLIYVDSHYIMMTSHENFPEYEDRNSKFGLVLLHYKFLPGEEARIREYASSEVHDRGSELYKQYEKLYDNGGQTLYFEGSHKWTGVECLKEFEIIERLT